MSAYVSQIITGTVLIVVLALQAFLTARGDDSSSLNAVRDTVLAVFIAASSAEAAIKARNSATGSGGTDAPPAPLPPPTTLPVIAPPPGTTTGTPE